MFGYTNGWINYLKDKLTSEWIKMNEEMKNRTAEWIHWAVKPCPDLCFSLSLGPGGLSGSKQASHQNWDIDKRTDSSVVGTTVFQNYKPYRASPPMLNKIFPDSVIVSLHIATKVHITSHSWLKYSTSSFQSLLLMPAPKLLKMVIRRLINIS